MRLVVLCALSVLCSVAKADLWRDLCADSIGIDSTRVGTLAAEVDALAFFRDNEYDSRVTRGYSLPGFRLQPKLTYTPLRNVHLELGAQVLVYDGANKYPNQVYRDIATWKGNQYQRGAHALPFFRAQAQFRHLTVVVGDIYGAQNHQLVEPLYNPEQNLSADPEMGFQLLLNRRYIHLDTWLDWQSYIFRNDSQQEAFTVGTNATLKWSAPQRRIRFSSPLQLLIQHRGGEQDTTHLGVQTLVNAAVGVRMDCSTHRRRIDNLRAEVNGLFSYQENGRLWPFDTGAGIHTAVSLSLLRCLHLGVGYVGIPKQFANLYGNPFFGTLSNKESGITFRGMHTTYLHADYVYSFSPVYRLGAGVDAYRSDAPSAHSTCFSFGIYFRACPSFRLWQKERK